VVPSETEVLIEIFSYEMWHDTDVFDDKTASIFMVENYESKYLLHLIKSNQYNPPKSWLRSTTLHGITYHKTIILLKFDGKESKRRAKRKRREAEMKPFSHLKLRESSKGEDTRASEILAPSLDHLNIQMWLLSAVSPKRRSAVCSSRWRNRNWNYSRWYAA
jgi:hypothetical protein